MRDGGAHLIHLRLSLLQTAVAGEVGRLLGGSTLCCRGSSGRGRPMMGEIFRSLREDITKNTANKDVQMDGKISMNRNLFFNNASDCIDVLMLREYLMFLQ